MYASGGTYGVQAYGSTYGVYGRPPRTASTDRAAPTASTERVRPASTGPAARGSGVYGTSSHPNVAAVYGTGGMYGVQGANGRTAGVRGDSGYVGVWGEGADWGFFSIATRTTGQNYGIMAETKSPRGLRRLLQGQRARRGHAVQGGRSLPDRPPARPGPALAVPLVRRVAGHDERLQRHRGARRAAAGRPSGCPTTSRPSIATSGTS